MEIKCYRITFDSGYTILTEAKNSHDAQKRGNSEAKAKRLRVKKIEYVNTQLATDGDDAASMTPAGVE